MSASEADVSPEKLEVPITFDAYSHQKNLR